MDMKEINLQSINRFLREVEKTPYITALRYLSAKTEINMNCQNAEKIIYLFVGNIAAGKTTLAYNFIKYFDLIDLPYVNTDIYYNVFFRDKSHFDTDYEEARTYTDEALNNILKEKKSFVWETVLSKSKKQDFLKKCISAGYKIYCVFVGAPLDLTLNRMYQRSRSGGHLVSYDFLKDRYYKNLLAFSWVRFLVDTLVVIDNTDNPSLVYYSDSKMNFLSDLQPDWFKSIIYS